ncbi:MAG: putative rane protein [Streptomyces oryziradicis]|nr:acyltransferase [Actinacidiphila oryziradicis]MCW2873627.1 putative rane protein [Actinacidiphila oryziradicis]
MRNADAGPDGISGDIRTAPGSAGVNTETSAPPARTAVPAQTRGSGPAAGGEPGGRRPPRLRALDGLRLVAALMVCLYHYTGRDGVVAGAWGQSPKHLFPAALTGAASYGCLGVQIFFVISGFVICMSGWGRTLKAFTVSRVTRLYPAYWAAILLVTAVFALPWVAYRTVSPSDLLTNLTMLQQPVGAERVLGVCWTLWAELRFYLLFALAVVWPGATRQRVLMFCALWMAGAVLADASGEPFLKLVLVPEYAPFFIGGIGLYLVHRYGHDALAWGVVAAGWLLGQRYAVKALVAPAHVHVFHHRSALAVIAVVTLGFVAVAVVTLVPRIAGIGWRWLTTAGALTYPFYLVHEHLGWVAIHGLRHGLGLRPWVVLPLAVTGMLVLAWLMYRWVERPLAPRLKRLLTS